MPPRNRALRGSQGCHLAAQRRKQYGWTLRQAGQNINVDYTLLHRFETGERAPNEQQVKTMALVFLIPQEAFYAPKKT